MPPRFAYWTILIDGAPTAFRARDRAELQGVFRQLSNRNPNVVMKWFARGKLWDSPEQEREATREAARAVREPRGPDWRPGGKHEDPRARFDKRREKPRREKPRREREGGAIARAGGGHGLEPRGERSGRPREATGRGAPREFRRDARSPHGERRSDRRDSKPANRERRPWHKGRGPRAGTGPRRDDRHLDERGAFPRTAAAGHKTTDIPGEPEPPAPPQPPGPERPPKPGQEPVPEVPDEETIKILPEPPERASADRRKK